MAESTVAYNRNWTAIAAVVTISAIVAGWYLQSSDPSNLPTSDQHLRRRNAVRRQRRRTRHLSVTETEPQPPEQIPDVNGAGEAVEEIIQALDRQETLPDDIDTEDFIADGAPNTGKSQNMLDLLFQIAADTAKREGFIHRGVECNSCGAHPIQGIRYHCSNCYDFDLCETCEAAQMHTKTHVFYKVRVPAPIRGHIKHVAPVWYPGKPNMLVPVLPHRILKPLKEKTQMDKEEIDALYDQFKCLAGHEWSSDPIGVGMAIDRTGFDKYFMPPNSLRPPPPSLIYDRIFAYYDTNNDGLIGFEEFLQGLAGLQNKTRHAKLERIFKGYDMNTDGYVDRKDFLRMFRAYYALSKEITREMIAAQEEDMVDDSARNFIAGSAPISTAFTPSNLQSHASRGGIGKSVDANGDLLIDDDQGALQEDLPPYGDRNESIGNGALQNQRQGHPWRSFREDHGRDIPLIEANTSNLTINHVDDVLDEEIGGEDPILQLYGWPPLNTIEPEDVTNALGENIPVEEIMDPVDRSRVFYAQSRRLDRESEDRTEDTRRSAVTERWKRREFYTDVEEGMSAPPGYTEHDSSDDEGPPPSALKSPTPDFSTGSRRPSLRSRSSSKVRFEDDLDDTDHETRSNTSSRSIPVGERWGGYEILEAEKEVGKEVLYQAVQEGFNDLLNSLFKEKEDLGLEAAQTRAKRLKWKDKIEEYQRMMKRKEEQKEERLKDADMERTMELLRGGRNPSTKSEKPDEAAELADQMNAQDSKQKGEDEAADLVSSSSEPGLSQDEDNDASAPFSPADLNPTSESSAEPSSPPPSPRTLAIWSYHNEVDVEAKKRGGHGKLNFEEFEGKMIEDEDAVDNDVEVERALGKVRPTTARAGEEDEGDWRPRAGIGKLGFVGSWLEMASF